MTVQGNSGEDAARALSIPAAIVSEPVEFARTGRPLAAEAEIERRVARRSRSATARRCPAAGKRSCWRRTSPQPDGQQDADAVDADRAEARRCTRPRPQRATFALVFADESEALTILLAVPRPRTRSQPAGPGAGRTRKIRHDRHTEHRRRGVDSARLANQARHDCIAVLEWSDRRRFGRSLAGQRRQMTLVADNGPISTPAG